MAYAEDEDSIKELWPEAYDINVLEKDTEIRFTLRFPKPEWYELYERELEECDRFIWVTDACLRDGIIRKVVGDSFIGKIIDSGFVFNPVRINIL